MKWPDYFPNGCPPDDSEYPNGTVYHFTNKRNPKEKDFLTHMQRQKPCNDRCKGCGLSVFTIFEEMLRLKGLPYFKKKFIASANLKPDHGKIKNTPSAATSEDHHTWWVPTNVQPWDLFQNVDVE